MRNLEDVKKGMLPDWREHKGDTNERSYPCRLCEIHYWHSVIHKENGFLMFNAKRFICPGCKSILGSFIVDLISDHESVWDSEII